MKNKKLLLIPVILFLLGMLSHPVFTLAELGNHETQSTVEHSEHENDMEVSEEVQNKIRESDPANFEKNMKNYRGLLNDLHVHATFKKEIERLVLEDDKIWNLVIAYEYVYHQFGTIADVESMVKQKEQGADWENLFHQYEQEQAAFIPRAFEQEYLEKLMNTPGVNADDIMIADRVSFQTEQPFETLITARMEDETWQDINAREGILYSDDQLPRVQVTSEQLDIFTQSSGMTEQQVVEAFVLADKVDKEPKTIIEKLSNGYSVEAIYAESYVEKYR